jgi:hypothetical protein
MKGLVHVPMASPFVPCKLALLCGKEEEKIGNQKKKKMKKKREKEGVVSTSYYLSCFISSFDD